MTEKTETPLKIPLIERVHAIPKLLFCALLGVIVSLVFQTKEYGMLNNIMIGWDTFSLCMVIMNWITFAITNSRQIRQQSKVQDASRSIIFIIILISTFASFLAVLLLILSKNKSSHTESIQMAIAIAGMIFSWLLIHTTFTLRYAHIFYGDHKSKPDTAAGGLEFPGEEKPEYFDFAYFSFVLGMTFQVSDVQITSKRLRRLALLHGLLSFGFNTIMIALTINLIASFG